MKIRAWIDENTSEATLYIRLRQEGNRVVVCLAHDNGEFIAKGDLLFLEAGKPIVRAAGVFLHCGFPLTKKARQIRIYGLSEEEGVDYE